MDDPRTLQVVLAEQFRLTADLCILTGEYHRLLQKVAAAGFLRQMAESGSQAELAEAERGEIAAAMAAESCELRVNDLEQRLAVLTRELAALSEGPLR